MKNKLRIAQQIQLSASEKGMSLTIDPFIDFQDVYIELRVNGEIENKSFLSHYSEQQLLDWLSELQEA